MSGLSGGLKAAAVALLVHQLTKHAQGGSAGMQNSNATATGGLGGILGGLLGGGASGGLGGLLGGGGAGGGLGGLMGGSGGAGGGLGGLLGGGSGGMTGGGGLGGLLGGLGGMLGGLRDQGLGSHVDSWVSSGPNHQVSPQQLERAFDPQELDEAARHAGTDRGSLLNEISQVLPNLVDRMTPQGQLPQREHDVHSGGLGGLLGSLLGGDAPRR